MLADKKQVKVYLDILKVNKKNGLDVLDYVVIKDGMLNVSNGYALVANEVRTAKSLELSREDLETWYKAADNKSQLTLEDFKPLSHTPPNYKELVERLQKDLEEPVKDNEFNPEYLKALLPAFQSVKIKQGSNYVLQLKEGNISLLPHTIYLMGKKK